jgi:Xaa-Pro aminopeptidase
MPSRFCNFERLLEFMARRDIEGVVLNGRQNVFYMTGFWLPALQADEPFGCIFILSRSEPDHPIIITPDATIGIFHSQPTWVEDIRLSRRKAIQKDITTAREFSVDDLIPDVVAGKSAPWYKTAAQSYRLGDRPPVMVQAALQELGLTRGNVAVDQYSMKHLVDAAGASSVDAYWLMMGVRTVKTQVELELLAEATSINRRAQEHMVREWEPGLTWGEARRRYTEKVADLGGMTDRPFVNALDTMSASRSVLFTPANQPDAVLGPGTNIMLDCHGYRNGYCWDGGKTWRIGEPIPSGRARSRLRAAAAAVTEVNAACKPGATEEQLTATGRGVLRKHGLPEADDALFFFHGLGLSHTDLDLTVGDWTLEEDSVLPTHLYIPGGPGDRVWLEDVVRIRRDGGQGFFEWDYVDWA